MKSEERESKAEWSAARGTLVLLLSLFLWMGMGTVVSAVLLKTSMAQSDLGNFFILFAPYVLLFLALTLGTRFFCQASLESLISNQRRGSYALCSGLLYLGATAILTCLFSHDIVPDTSPWREKLQFLLPVLILVPMETFSEEIFFRVLPARILYGKNLPKGRKALPLMVGGGFFFLLPHLANPEVLKSGTALYSILYYFLWGALAMGMGCWMNGFEAPIAMHTANNLFIALFVNYRNSAMPSRPLFQDQGETSSLEQLGMLLSLFLLEGILSYIYLRKGTENHKQ